MMRAVVIAVSAALGVLAASPAITRAFSDSEMFAASIEEGGGEGKYFTGSQSDPYSCSVCHRQGAQPKLEITGLPQRLVAGQRHEVTVRWKSESSHSLHLELARADGRHAALELPDLETLPVEQRCDGAEDGSPAVFSRDVEQRRVLGVTDCGASELKFWFTVPEGAPVLYLSLGVVQSDGSGTPDGDGALELRQRLGAVAPAADSCSVLGAIGARGGASSLAAALVMALLGLLYRRRRAAIVPLLAATSACFSPSHSADPPAHDAAAPYFSEDFAEILAERAAAPAGSGGANCERRPSLGRELRFKVRTVSGTGRYRPRNVGAIWIEDESGKFVRTLEHWGARRAKWLEAFLESSAGDLTDAITGPTLDAHKVHELTWNLKDAAGCEVNTGRYQLRLEMTDWSGTGVTAAIPFELSAQPWSTQPEDQQPFLEMELAVQ